MAKDLSQTSDPGPDLYWSFRLYGPIGPDDYTLIAAAVLTTTTGQLAPPPLTIGDICRLESRVESRADYGLSHDLLEQRMQLGGFDRLLQDGRM
jgi:hypothetical protein